MRTRAEGECWLRIEGLRKRFLTQTVFNEFNLCIQRGEVVCLLGPSGIGKSTLIRILLGLISPDGGRLMLGDREINHLPIARRNIGVVYQDYSLFENLTVRGNVAFPLEAREGAGLRTLSSLFGIEAADIQSRVDQALEWVQMRGHERKRPQQLSGGEQQRVALARALVGEPDLLCLDEPLAALDMELRGAVLSQIRRLHHERGTTTLYVTHNVAEAFSIGDRVGVMHRGQLEQIDTPQGIYRKPLSEFVGRLTGELNVLTVEDSNATPEGAACRIAGGQMVTIADPPVPRGARIGIRPELLQLGVLETVGAPHLTARLEHSTFLGPWRRFELTLVPGGQEITISIPAQMPISAAGGISTLVYNPKDWIVFL